MLKENLRWLVRLIYRVEVKGFENYHKAGERVLIVANHTSFLDPFLMWLFFPDDITFAINTQIFKRWWIQPFLKFSQVFPMDPTHPMSLKNLIHHLQTDTKTVIFPEGRITVTGGLMKIYDGTGMVADKSEAAILPVRINGGQYTHFSRLHKVVRLRLFPKITITILPHTRIDAPNDLRGKLRRKFSGHILTDIMTEMMFATSNYRQTIFAGLLEARRINGGKHLVANDMERKPLSYDVLVARTFAIGNALAKITSPDENVGIFLPNSTKTLCVVLGLQLHSRVPAMMNYSIGSAGMVSACQIATVNTLLTSRRFVEAGRFENEIITLGSHVKLVYLEDLAENITGFHKIIAYIQAKTAGFWYPEKAVNPDHPAVVLFTSGSEGSPKGVVLSHSNIVANHKQICARISFNPQDVVLNFLPMFHSFGFTVGTLLPVLNGMAVFFYPTPLHYTVIPEMAYETNATILFGTNTFLAAYGKKAHPYDFYKMRYVVAGAEKLQESTRALWADKFGIRIMEGYGATETAPVTAVNTPMDYKSGTVGRFMPDMGYELEAIPGISDAGQLHVNGPNIMLGYLLHDNPGVLVPPASRYGKGWYDTGDIVHVDEDGFISIRGRSKRFAKVSGEMVSLTAVEQLAANAWPAAMHAAISIPDSKKGEQVLLLTTQHKAIISQLLDASPGIAPILLPKKIMIVEAIPVLATGKINYPAITELVISQLKLR
jgi:acyl-[acyl-carrier-protein]-phospholipid O-acyltransferase / long-chain-fatty-acid--[acyl-carrier-protein] ligase